ncbi:MAG TPA: response regulator [Chloroflexota bacterium]|jgi:CheY-like chemotaxis protein
MALVLVVDDDPAIRALVREVLEAAPGLAVRVREARDGYEALLWLREEPADLILLDLRMPRVDGWGVLLWLKSNARTAAIPVVVLTALDPATALRGVARGPDGVLAKPFDLDALVGTVAAALGPGRAGRGALAGPEF